MPKPHVRTTTTARVQVLVDVPVGSWGPDCKLDQVYRQAEELACARLKQSLRDTGASVVGAVRVLAVTTDTSRV